MNIGFLFLGTDKKQYTLSEFIAQNKGYHSALGIIIQTPKTQFHNGFRGVV